MSKRGVLSWMTRVRRRHSKAKEHFFFSREIGKSVEGQLRVVVVQGVTLEGERLETDPSRVFVGVPAPSGAGDARRSWTTTIRPIVTTDGSCATEEGTHHGPGNQAETIREFYKFIRPKVYHRGSW